MFKKLTQDQASDDTWKIQKLEQHSKTEVHLNVIIFDPTLFTMNHSSLVGSIYKNAKG